MHRSPLLQRLKRPWNSQHAQRPPNRRLFYKYPLESSANRQPLPQRFSNRRQHLERVRPKRQAQRSMLPPRKCRLLFPSLETRCRGWMLTYPAFFLRLQPKRKWRHQSSGNWNLLTLLPPRQRRLSQRARPKAVAQTRKRLTDIRQRRRFLPERQPSRQNLTGIPRSESQSRFQQFHLG